jgi:hypothetical protein
VGLPHLQPATVDTLAKTANRVGHGLGAESERARKKRDRRNQHEPIRQNPSRTAKTDLRETFLHSFTLKGRVNLLVYTSPESLRREMAEFIEFYNHRRYHEGIGNVAPADVYIDRREEILQRREGQRTVLRRIEYNLGCGETQNTGEPEPETIA